MDLLLLNNSAETIAARVWAIHQAVLRDSSCISQPNFDKISIDDLARLFKIYDRDFFGGWLAETLAAKTASPLRFRLSATMTRAGGKTSRYRRRTRLGGAKHYYEIAVASRMLFMTFRDVQRPVIVSGLTCDDRLSALQRIMEHEIIHLAEFLAWDETSCSGIRFKVLAARIFGHTDTRHMLVTPREHAAVAHGIRVGGMVQFDLDGQRFAGVVNRVHKRATVLVEHADGRPYSDGKKYHKFYVPLDRLRTILGTPY